MSGYVQNMSIRQVRSGRLAALAALALPLTACTPREVAAVVEFVAQPPESAAAPTPTLAIEATCTTLAVVADGWPDGSIIDVGIASQPGYMLNLDGGDGAHTYTIDPFSLSDGAYQYSAMGHLPGVDDPAKIVTDVVKGC